MSSSDESDLEPTDNQQEPEEVGLSEKETEQTTNGDAEKVVTWEDLVRLDSPNIFLLILNQKNSVSNLIAGSC